MQRQDPQAQPQNGSLGVLWRRAPAFRGIVYLAASVSLVAMIAFSFDQGNAGPSVPNVPETAKVVSQPSQSVAGNAEVPPASQQSAPGRESGSGPVQKPTAQAAASGAEEDAQLARCHPHLIPGSAAMPQIDVSKMADPSLGHVKLHFWVNGAGLVTREMLTSTTYATEAERQAELDFTKGLTFTVPNTTECRVREMELIGDVFEMRNAAGQWATYVRLYPRLSFDTDGVVRSRE